MKQYLLSIYHPEGVTPPPNLDQIMRDVDALNQELMEAGAWVFGGGLHPSSTATVVRLQDGDRSSVLLAEYTFNLRCCQGMAACYQSSASSWNGRTSIGRVIARASLRPHSSAASRSVALMMQSPPTCSLPSA